MLRGQGLSQPSLCGVTWHCLHQIENQIYHISSDARYLRPPSRSLKRPPAGRGDRVDDNAVEDDEEENDDDDDDDNESTRGEEQDPLEHVHKARVRWEKSLNEELLSIAKERGEPLAGPRPRASSSNSSNSGNLDGDGGAQLGGSSSKVSSISVSLMWSSEVAEMDCLSVCLSVGVSAAARAVPLRLGGPAGRAQPHRLRQLLVPHAQAQLLGHDQGMAFGGQQTYRPWQAQRAMSLPLPPCLVG